MKIIYSTLFALSLLFLTGCSKDFLKAYDKRIIGAWKITGINRLGFGGTTDNLPFRDGTFNFNEDGSTTYVSSAGITYQGSWQIEKLSIDGEGNRRTLQIIIVDFATQDLFSEFYDEVTFRGTDHFTASINQGLHTYVTHFRR